MKYSVTVPFVVFVTQEFEADSLEDAIDQARNEVSLTSFCGNGSTDRLIGVYEGSVDASDEPYESDGFAIEGFEVTE